MEWEMIKVDEVQMEMEVVDREREKRIERANKKSENA